MADVVLITDGDQQVECLCLTGDDVGMPEYALYVANVEPGCPRHDPSTEDAAEAQVRELGQQVIAAVRDYQGEPFAIGNVVLGLVRDLPVSEDRINEIASALALAAARREEAPEEFSLGWMAVLAMQLDVARVLAVKKMLSI